MKRNYENIDFTVRLIGIGSLHGFNVGLIHETIPRVRNDRGLIDKLDAPRRIVCIQLGNLTVHIVLRHRWLASVVKRQDIKSEADGLNGGGARGNASIPVGWNVRNSLDGATPRSGEAWGQVGHSQAARSTPTRLIR